MIDGDAGAERSDVVNRRAIVESEGHPRDRFRGHIGEAYT
jgi:hypothetical protein